jgi:hypothetical protein
MESITLKEQQLTIKNVIAACKDINKLNKRGYNFLYLASGFIAHYNLAGFKAYYTKEGFAFDNDLKTDILANKGFNQWDNFKPDNKDYNYYMSKKAIYNAICDSL